MQTATIISRILQSANEWCWDSYELERQESMFKESSAICEQLIWDDETMYELVQKQTVWLVAQFQTSIVKLAIIHYASDVDDVDDTVAIRTDVLVAMQREAVDETDEDDETDIVAMNQVRVAQDIDV